MKRRKCDETHNHSGGNSDAGRGTARTTLMPAQTSGEKTLTGIVSDAMCGQTHMMKDKADAVLR
jgi:hypothetical protein